MRREWTQDDACAPTWVPEANPDAGAHPGGHAFIPPVPHNNAPQMVAARYRVLRRLGSGGCGDVHLAIDTALQGRQVALKRLPLHMQADPRCTARLAHEAKMAVRVRHPHIVTVYDYDVDASGAPFVVMEYVRGETLASLAHRRLALVEVAAIGRQLCQALTALHDEGIVHRDVKPSNIMVRRHQGRLTVKLVDFGLAKRIEPDAEAAAQTQEVVCGTPQYMAPEQIIGGPVDGRTDLFGLACVLYELLTGTPPGGRAARQLILTRQMYSTPPPLHAQGVQVPDALDRALRAALQKEPNQRPDSLHDLEHALAQILMGPISFLENKENLRDHYLGDEHE